MLKGASDHRIRMIILHYTAVSFTETLSIFNRGQVSAHYLVPEKHALDYIGWCSENSSSISDAYQLVPDFQRAWHAGESYWRGRSELNDSSIGIEIVYCPLEESDNFPHYPQQQIDAVVELCQGLIDQYQISSCNILGHSDVSYLRKSDPGPRFPWKHLASQGVGAWANEDEVEQRVYNYLDLDDDELREQIVQRLGEYGYMSPSTLEEEICLLKAFCAHFAPEYFLSPIKPAVLATVDVLIEQSRWTDKGVAEV